MDIELTSSREDGSWTWRAAGALQPRGVIPGSMVADHGRVGEVLRVEADFELDGITIVAVIPSKGRSREPERIEIIRPAPGSFQPVTTALVGKDDRRGRGRDTWDGERRESRGAPGGGGARPRGEGGRGRPGSGPGALGRDGKPREPQTRERPARDRQPRETEVREGAPAVRRTPRPPSEGGGGRPSSPTGPARPPRPARPERPTRTRPPRLVVGTTHRDALFATYPPEQRPIAEQLAQGGLASVRRSLADEQAAAKAEGRTTGNSEAIIAVAEQMLPAVRESIWLDRAEAAVAMLDVLTLRDLRSTVAAAAPRDEIGRELLSKLREALTTRVTKLRSGWEEEITKALDEDRVLQALRLSARPPEPTTRFPAALVERLVAAAGAGMSSTVPKDRWLALLEAASNSPVRRSIHPEGLPADADGSVRQAATEAAGRVPALAKLLGLAMPPPPRPMAQRPLPPRPPRPVRTTAAAPTADPAASNDASDVAMIAAEPEAPQPVAEPEAPQPVAEQSEAAQAERAQAEVAQPEPAQAEPVPSDVSQPDVAQPEPAQPDDSQSEVARPEGAETDVAPAEAGQLEVSPSDPGVPDQSSSEPAAAASDQPEEPAASVIEGEPSTTDSESPTAGELPVVPDGAEGETETVASDVTDQPDAPSDAEATPKDELVEPLDNTVPVEPVGETLGQGEEP
jgi:hypothetical protein